MGRGAGQRRDQFGRARGRMDRLARRRVCCGPARHGTRRMNRQCILASRPEGIAQAENFALVTAERLPLADGEIRVRNQFLSVEPAMRGRSEEHTSELQSLMRISYAVFCLKKQKNNNTKPHNTTHTTQPTQHTRYSKQ